MFKRVIAYLVVAVMCIAALPMGTAMAAETRMARCDLRLREKTSVDSKTLVVIPGGTELTITGTSGGWSKTSYKGHTGYVSTSYLVDLTRSGYYPLKEGDNSVYVKNLQEKLIELGYMTGKASGEYTGATRLAVTEFQKVNGIGQDGMAGGETQRIMYEENPKAANGSTVGSGTAIGTQPTESTGGTNSDTTMGVASETTLRLGSRGEEVKNLQARLKDLGYLSGNADGIYGTSTEKAVKAFQKNCGLNQDGKAGKLTQNRLYSNSAKKADGSVVSGTDTGSTNNNTGTTGTYATLKRGVTSSEVKALQQRLKDLGYLSASATGFYGTQTQAAIQAFQKQHGLKEDGIAGNDTQTALFASSAQKAGSTSSTGTNNNNAYATLKEGMKSNSVTTLQKKLRDLGYLTASATGFFGSQTKAAVVAFQKKNGLNPDGVAGSATQTKLYGDTAISAGSSSSATGNDGKISGPSKSSVQLLHWFNTVKPSLKSGSTLQVYDPASGLGWKLKAMSLGRHCDSEPLTAEDTRTMNSAFGNKTTWTPKVVYIKLPSGAWTMATMHNTPHLSGTISGNNFDGHLCVHFLRDMSEVSKNDPDYGVQNQKVLRDGWKSLTGNTVN